MTTSKSPPLSSTSGSHDPVQLLLTLVEAYDSIDTPFPSKAQTRIQIADELKLRGVPMDIINTSKHCPVEGVVKFNRVVKIGHNLVFTSPGKTVKDTMKGTGNAVLHFIESLKELIKQTKIGK